MKITIAIPALNEAEILSQSVERLRAFVDEHLADHEVTIVIADNDSSDATPEVARELEGRLSGVRHLRLERRGKGLAIRSAWLAFPADVCVFMDADLSTDLKTLPDLISSAAESGGLAVGSRYHAGSKVARSRFRRLLSYGYQIFQRLALGTRTADLPCGFKAASAAVIGRVLPLVKDDGWFFDSELVVRTERAGLPVVELPVAWNEDSAPGRRSKVSVPRLVIKYVRSVLALQTDLASPPPVGAPYRLERRERVWVAILAAVAIAASSIAPLYAWWLSASRHEFWTGLQFLAPGDMNVYLSYIGQVRDGAWLLTNAFTAERLLPVFNLLWLPVGWLARLPGLSAIGAFHAARALLIAPFVIVVYLAAALFLREPRARLTASVLTLFGSGLGVYLVPLLGYQAHDPKGYAWPIDLWVGEANGFLTMTYSPHFLASWTLLLLALYLLLRSFLSGRLRYAVYAGLAALVLLEFHPFHAPTLYAVPAVWVGWSLWQRRRGYWRNLAAYGIFLAISLPSVAYHYYLTHYSPDAVALMYNNANPTPALLYVLVGFGVVGALWPFGYLVGRRRDRDDGRTFFLVVWIVVQFVLAYSPLVFGRRLLEGLEFPLVVLSTPALLAIWDAVRDWTVREPMFRRVSAASLILTLFLPSTVIAVTRNLGSYRTNSPPIFFLDADERAALDWAAANTPVGSVFLGDQKASHSIVGLAGRRVYAGHEFNTIDFEKKMAAMQDFYAVMGEAERDQFLDRNGIDYVYYGPEEQKLGAVAETARLRTAASFGSIIIFRREPAPGFAATGL